VRLLLRMSQRLNATLCSQIPTNLKRFLAAVRTDVHMRILSGSIISVQSHHLSHANVIALVDPYIIEMRIHHDHSIRSLELDVTRRRLSCISWSVGYPIYPDLGYNTIEGGMDLDMPAIPVFVVGTVCLIEPDHSLRPTHTTQDEAIRAERITEIA
jgi:hypothetical protein